MQQVAKGQHMRTLEIQERVTGQLPIRPVALKKFDAVINTYDVEASQRLENGKTVVVGGLSLIGEMGQIVGVVGIIRISTITPEGAHLKGWSLHIGHPNEKFRILRHFDTERSVEDTLLPLPNCMVYFACETDQALAEEDADAEVLMQIAHFVPPFISDAGPPEGIDW